MGYAVFPLRVGGGRVLVDATQVVSITEEGSTDGTGKATLCIPGAPVYYLQENALTVYNRVAAAIATTGIVTSP